MTYTLTKANFFCEPSTIFEATTIFYYDFLAYSHHGGFVFTKRLVLWSRIRDRVSDWLWSRLRSYWLAWSLTSLFRPTLSSFTVCRHSRLEIRHIVRGHAIMISMSRRVYLGPLSVPASHYGYWGIHVCPGNFVTFVPASLSRRECPGLQYPPSCPGVWK